MPQEEFVDLEIGRQQFAAGGTLSGLRVNSASPRTGDADRHRTSKKDEAKRSMHGGRVECKTGAARWLQSRAAECDRGQQACNTRVTAYKSGHSSTVS